MSDGIEVTGSLEFLQPVEKLIPTADRSKRVEPKGTIEPEDVHIFLTEAMLREVLTWSKSDLGHELGGVFVGDLYSHKGVLWLDIAGYVRAEHYENTAASFCFTHDSWSAISRVREGRFGDRTVVGWHHTHPGYGIFLSGTDMFSHRNYFNLPWMFALVVDPRQDTLGFFQWKKGMQDVKPCGFFFVR
jgi:proteasome lid subunit RPN8/RPN11